MIIKLILNTKIYFSIRVTLSYDNYLPFFLAHYLNNLEYIYNYIYIYIIFPEGLVVIMPVVLGKLITGLCFHCFPTVSSWGNIKPFLNPSLKLFETVQVVLENILNIFGYPRSTLTFYYAK